MTAYSAAARTVTPAVAIVMLYDGAISRLVEARAAALDGRIEDRCTAVGKAYAIIHGLQCQLDFAAGGEIAVLLDDYYTYVLHRMPQINIRNDPGVCDELVARLREMRESWSAIARGGTEPSPAAAPAPPPTTAAAVC
jgi:flagellar protein FliS